MNFDKARDPHRPIYHFSPPLGLWGGGPDGTVYHDGEYHVFYQYDPYMGSSSGNASWGHTASPDLVHWEHRPVAIGPTPFSPGQYKAFSECDLVKQLDRSNTPPIVYDREVCFSGSAVINDGVPTIVYTGFFCGVQDAPIMQTRTQCLATSDDGMLTWKKHPANPVIAHPPAELVDLSARDEPLVWRFLGRTDDNLSKGDLTAWHDPHVWREGDLWYMALGCGFFEIGGAVLLYSSKDLIEWEYLHPLWVGEDPGFNRFLVPDFFPLGDRHVLLGAATTRGRPGKSPYLVGSYEDLRFSPEVEGLVDTYPSACFHCPRTLLDSTGRRILFGSMTERRPTRKIKQGWATVLSLPRVLSLDPGGRLLMDPASEVCSSHDPDWQFDEIDLAEASPFRPGDVLGDALELEVTIDPGNATEMGLKLRCTPGGEESTAFHYNRKEDTASVDTTHASLDPDTGRSVNGTPLSLKPGEPLRLHVFLDRSTVEVFANRRACLSCRTYPTQEDSLGIELFAEGGTASVRKLRVWQKQSIFY